MNIIIYLLVLTTAFSFSVIASNKNEISPINEVANKLVGSITTIANEELNNAQALGVFTKHYGNTKEVLKAIEDLTNGKLYKYSRDGGTTWLSDTCGAITGIRKVLGTEIDILWDKDSPAKSTLHIVSTIYFNPWDVLDEDFSFLINQAVFGKMCMDALTNMGFLCKRYFPYCEIVSRTEQDTNNFDAITKRWNTEKWYEEIESLELTPYGGTIEIPSPQSEMGVNTPLPYRAPNKYIIATSTE